MSVYPFAEWLAFLRGLDLPWCVVVAAPGREKAVQAELALAGWSTYLPMQTEWLKPTRLRRRTNRPVFARYLFAACNPGGDQAAHREIRGLISVHWPASGDPVRPRCCCSAVRVDLLARLMLTEVRHGFDLTYEKPRARKKGLVCGQEVTVRAGTMRGMEALILKVLSEREVLVRLPLAICGTDEMVLQAQDAEVIVVDGSKAVREELQAA